jgi:hypothetical protein
MSYRVIFPKRSSDIESSMKPGLSSPNSMEKDSEIKILPEVHGFGESGWRACVFSEVLVL